MVLTVDFLANQEGSPPVVTAAMLLEILLARQGLTIDDAALPPDVLLAITPHSLRVLQRLLDLGPPRRYALAGASVYRPALLSFAVVGPAIGAPVVANVLECLAALGVRRVIGIGWCGSLQATLPAGALIVPRDALREEGTSYHYLAPHVPARADAASGALLLQACSTGGYPATSGTIWTTDALYREARAKVTALAAAGVLAVEMECSAIFAVAECLGLAAAVLLAVSDELASPTWRPGFFGEQFQAGHEAACRIVLEVCATLPSVKPLVDQVS